MLQLVDVMIHVHRSDGLLATTPWAARCCIADTQSVSAIPGNGWVSILFTIILSSQALSSFQLFVCTIVYSVVSDATCHIDLTVTSAECCYSC